MHASRLRSRSPPRRAVAVIAGPSGDGTRRRVLVQRDGVVGRGAVHHRAGDEHDARHVGSCRSGHDRSRAFDQLLQRGLDVGTATGRDVARHVGDDGVHDGRAPGQRVDELRRADVRRAPPGTGARPRAASSTATTEVTSARCTSRRTSARPTPCAAPVTATTWAAASALGLAAACGGAVVRRRDLVRRGLGRASCCAQSEPGLTAASHPAQPDYRGRCGGWCRGVIAAGTGLAHPERPFP